MEVDLEPEQRVKNAVAVDPENKVVLDVVPEPEPEPGPPMEHCDAVAEHIAHSFPSRQVSVEVGERVTLQERGSHGWWKVQKRDWSIGWVPCSKLVVVSAAQLASEAVEHAERMAADAGIDRSMTMSLERSVAIYSSAASLDAAEHDEATWLALTESYSAKAEASKAALAGARSSATSKLEQARRAYAALHPEGTHLEVAMGCCDEGLAVEGVEDPNLTAELEQLKCTIESAIITRDDARRTSASRQQSGRASMKNGDYAGAMVSFKAALEPPVHSAVLKTELKAAIAAAERALREEEFTRAEARLNADRAKKHKAQVKAERQAAAARAKAEREIAVEAKAIEAAQAAAALEEAEAAALAAAPPCAQPGDVLPFLPRQLGQWLLQPDVLQALGEHRNPGTQDEFNGVHQRRFGSVVVFEMWGLTELVEALVAEGHKFPAHVCDRRNQKLLKILREIGVEITAGQSFDPGAKGVVALLEKIYGAVVQLVLIAGGDIVRVSDEGLVAVFFDGEGEPAGSAAENALRCAAAAVIDAKSMAERYLSMRCVMSTGWLDTMILGGESFHYRYCVTGAPFFGIHWLLETVERGEIIVKENSWAYISSIAKGTWCLAGEDGAYRIVATDVDPPPIVPGPQALKPLVDHAEPVNRPLVRQVQRYFPTWETEEADEPFKSLEARTLWKFLPSTLAVEMNARTTTGLVRQVTNLHILLHDVSTGLDREPEDDSDDEEHQQQLRSKLLAEQLQRVVGVVQNAVHGRGFITGLHLYDDERGYVCTAAFDCMSCRRGDPTAAGVLAAMQIAEDCGEGACSIGVSTEKGFVGPSSNQDASRLEYCVLGRGKRMAQFLSAVREQNGEVIIDTKTMEVVDDQVMDGRVVAEARPPIKDRNPAQQSQPPVPIFVLHPQKQALTIGLWAGRFASRWEMARPYTVGREDILAQMTERTSELVGTSGRAEKEAADAAAAAAAAEAEAKDVEEARQELQRWQETGDLVAIDAAEKHLAQQEAEAELAAAIRLKEWQEAETAGAAEERAPGEGSVVILAGRRGSGKSHLLRVAENIMEARAEGATRSARLLHAADITDPSVCCREPLAAWRPVIHSCLGLEEGDERNTFISRACREWAAKHVEFSSTVQHTLVELIRGRAKAPTHEDGRAALVRLVVEVVCTAALGWKSPEDKQGLAVVIDDASQLDQLSWDVIRTLAQRLEASPSDRETYSTLPLLLILAVDVNPLDGSLLCPLDLGRWPILTVSPLTVAETADLFLSVSPDASVVDHDLSSILNQECLGLPRYILEWISVQILQGGVKTIGQARELQWYSKYPDGEQQRLVADTPASLTWELMHAFAAQTADWQLTLQLCATISTAVAGLRPDPEGRGGFSGDFLVQMHPRRLAEPVLSRYIVQMERLGFLIRAQSNHDALHMQTGEDPLVRLAPDLAAGQLPAETWAFRSEEIRQAVYHTLTTEERCNMHSSLVKHLEICLREGMNDTDLGQDKWDAAEHDRRIYFVQLLEHAALAMEQSTVLRLVEKLPGGPGMVFSDAQRNSLRAELSYLKPVALRKRALIEEIRGDLIKKAEDSEFPKDSLIELIVSHLVFNDAREERREDALRDRLRAETVEQRRLFDEAAKANARPAQMERRRQAVAAAEVAMWTHKVAGNPDSTNPSALAVRYFPLAAVMSALKTRHDDDMSPLAANWNDVHWAVAQWKIAGHNGSRPKRSASSQATATVADGDSTGEHMYGAAIDLRPSGRFDSVQMSFLEPPRSSMQHDDSNRLLLPGCVPLLDDREQALQLTIERSSKLVRSLTDAAEQTLRFGAYAAYPNAQSMAMEQEALLARKATLAAKCTALEQQLAGRDDPILDRIKPSCPPPEPEKPPEAPPSPVTVKPVEVVDRGCCWCCCRPRKRDKRSRAPGLSAAAAAYADDY